MKESAEAARIAVPIKLRTRAGSPLGSPFRAASRSPSRVLKMSGRSVLVDVVGGGGPAALVMFGSPILVVGVVSVLGTVLV